MRALSSLRASLREGDLASWAPHALAALFGCGAVLVAASCLLPGRTAPGFALAASGVAILTAAGLIALSRRLSIRDLNLVLALGTVLIALVIFSSGRATSPDALLFVWVALFGGFFLSRSALAAQIGFVAAAYAVVLVALPERTVATGDTGPQHLLLGWGPWAWPALGSRCCAPWSTRCSPASSPSPARTA